jgi:hypothetical protein
MCECTGRPWVQIQHSLVCCQCCMSVCRAWEYCTSAVGKDHTCDKGVFFETDAEPEHRNSAVATWLSGAYTHWRADTSAASDQRSWHPLHCSCTAQGAASPHPTPPLTEGQP